jgi:non-canonical purine NTP pyrophosphatase (RdgB/HAM1 family)
MNLLFVTGNPSKYDEAERVAKKFKVILSQEKADINELQSDDIEAISLDKAKQAYELFQKPLFVNDSGWSIPSLNGFPGSFMSYINNWFAPEDFLKLVEDKKDRSIILEELIVYIDKNGTKVFKQTRPGVILQESRGKGRYASDSVVSFDGVHSIAEHYAKLGAPPTDNDQAYIDLFNFVSTKDKSIRK